MSFETYARRVRDEGLPTAHRHGALRCAVGHYHPLGFNATWAYITAVACPWPDVRRDGPALLRALGALEDSRSVRLAEMEAFASTRRAEKSRGLRTPRSADTAALAGPRWPGREAPSRLGLVAAVADGHRRFRGLPVDASGAALRDALDGAAEVYLAQLGRLDRAAREAVSAVTREVRRTGSSPSVLAWHRFAALLEYAATPFAREFAWEEEPGRTA